MKLTDKQRAVLGALDALCGEMPADPFDDGRHSLCRPHLNGRHGYTWTAGHLRALQKKGLAYTNGPGAARGWWRITDAGRRALKEGE